MRLNIDCVRDILLSVEESSAVQGKLSFPSGDAFRSEYERLHRYSSECVSYHVRQCELSGLFYNYKPFVGSDCGFSVSDLSPKGHEFIENIREDNVFNIVKSVALKVGSTALSSINQIAISVISEIIKSTVMRGGF